MPVTTLRILDQVNVKFQDLDPFVRREMVEKLKHFLPSARYSPAYKLGRWDGTISFAQVSGATYLQLLGDVVPIIEKAGYEIEVEDLRPQSHFEFDEATEETLAHIPWPKGHPFEGDPIMLRDYQVEAINTFLANPQSIQSISTGAGKTILTATLSYLVEPHGRTLVVVPSKSLVTQTEKDYRNVGLDVGVFYGDRKEYGHKHTICTWQSLSSLMKKGEDSEISFEDFIDGVVAVMVDEVQSAKGTDLKTMLCGPLAHIPIRWGLTGTVPKDKVDQIQILIGLGPVVGEIKAVDLQELGVLSKCHIHIKQLQDDHVEFRDYHEEKDFLVFDDERLDWLAAFVKDITEKQGNTLLLFDRIDTGKLLQERIAGSVLINGSVKNETRNEEYDKIQDIDNGIVLASYGVAAVGINIPRIFNLVLLEPGKSFVRVIQSIGRGIRVAKDKDYVDVYDVTSSLKFSRRHLTKRKEFYKEASYPYHVEKVKYK